ncbi:MAG: PTS sugar transporter subunit IIC, partial [Bacteroidaceae bacterium]|nr:PTS sugar transporter subunit IIC [Bacteroidaceae bacterium]
MPNIIKNPLTWIPPTLAAAITGPISTCLFQLENVPIGAGMGLRSPKKALYTKRK